VSARRGDPRVCEVAALAVSGAMDGELGSGFLVDGRRRVVTARHVVQPVAFEATAWLVRPLGGRDWVPADVAYTAEVADVAVLALREDVQLPAGFGAVRVGVVAGFDPVEVRGVGFPASRRVRTVAAGLPIGDPEEIRGELRAATATKGDGMALHLVGSTPLPTTVGSPWAGMSGAAVRTGPWLVGVVAADPARFGTDRLKLALFDDEPSIGQLKLRRALGGAEWECADRPAGLLPPYVLRPSTVRQSARRLRAVYGLVPFAGREPELNALSGWCRTEDRAAVRLVTGTSGQGKTRLVAELAEMMAEQGWLAGFLSRSASASEVVELIGRSVPQLIIVDYADSRLKQVRQLINAIDAAPERVRILLVARRAGRWWDSLPYQTDSDLVEAAAETIALEDGPPLTLEARRSAYRSALETIGGCFGVTDLPVDEPNLSDEAFDAPLFIHLLALARIDSSLQPERSPTAPGGAPSVSSQLLDQVLLREDEEYWRPSAAAIPELVDATTRQRVVAAATLTAAGDEDHAIEVLSSVPGLTQITAVAAAHWYHELHGETLDGPYLRPVEPDWLGEHLVNEVLQQRPAFVNELHKLGPDGSVPRMLLVLERGASRYPTLRRALRGLFAQHHQAYIEHATTTADIDFGQLLAATFDEIADQSLADAVLAALPRTSVSLVDLSIAATQAALASSDPAEMAGHLNDLSVRFSFAGRREEALDAIDEAVTIRRELAAQRPTAFTADLALSLNNQSNRLSDVGRREEALDAIDEAVTIRRELAAHRPTAFTADLALSLNNQSNRLSDLGRREEALAAIQEAVTTYRKLARRRPAAFTRDLAVSLNNQASMLSDLGRREEALAAIDEAVTTYRELARHRPDAFSPDLALSLNNQSNRLSDLGRREEALAAIDEAVTTYRELARRRPDAFTPDLAMSLNNQSSMLSDLSRREEAFAAIDEAVTTYRELARHRPEAFTPHLAMSLKNLSVKLLDLGRREEALAAIDEAVTTYRELARHRPDAFTPELASSLKNLSVTLSDLGRREEALAAIDEAVRRVLPWLERMPWSLPDAGVQLGRRLISCCEKFGTEPDSDLVARLIAVLERAGILDESSDRPPVS
jgi:tetratricopeptide (TPR) repeat protein